MTSQFFCEIKSPHHSLLLQSHRPNSSRRYVSNFMKLSCYRKTNSLGFDYRLCVSLISLTGCIKVVVMLIDSVPNFYHRNDYVCSQSFRLLDLIPTATFYFSSVHGLLMILHISMISGFRREVD